MPNIYILGLIFSFQYSDFTIIRYIFDRFNKIWPKKNKATGETNIITCSAILMQNLPCSSQIKSVQILFDLILFLSIFPFETSK